MVNDQIYITSINKALDKSKVQGTLDLRLVELFNLYNYYIKFTDNLEFLGIDTYVEANRCFKENISKLKYKYPKIICNYKTVIFNDELIPGTEIVNTAPNVSDNNINISNVEVYNYSVADFLLNFSDSQNDSYKNLIIYPNISLNGILKYNNIELISPITIDIQSLQPSDILDLTYTRPSEISFNDVPYTFRVSDDNVNSLYSSLQNITMFSDVAVGDNQPPADIGDNLIIVGNRATTILTLFMFTGGLAPPYNDPEGDLIDAIRIVDISNANRGIYYVNGTPMVDGQIITREEINAGLFTHEAEDTDVISSDTFQFQARDEGSGIWID